MGYRVLTCGRQYAYMAAREMRPGRVLVVEDDESTALFVIRVLSRNGFDAAWVTDAEQASKRLDTEPFDVLLADCRLPGRSGLELARHARRSQPGLGIAVMTSFAEIGMETTARESGADDFFEKPLHFFNLVARIQDLVTRSMASGDEMSESPAPRTDAALPTASVPDVSPTREISEAPNFAGSGSDERAVPRDTVFAPPDSAAGDGGHPQPTVTDGLRWTRSSALSDPGGDRTPGCEGPCDGIQRWEVGRVDPGPPAWTLYPADDAVG
jgi:CheY-like chemotaxis protein